MHQGLLGPTGFGPGGFSYAPRFSLRQTIIDIVLAVCIFADDCSVIDGTVALVYRTLVW